MNQIPVSLPAALTLLAAAIQPVHAETTLAPVVVIAGVIEAPLTVVTDPQAPRQPVPAQDGADYLKTIPGFSVIRKGGTDGDPLLRGMAGSRLGILLDGEQILGGCGARMDPPTAYVFPDAYDSVTVLKGPQSVLYGPGNSAGSVRFERDNQRYTEPTLEGRASLTTGSAGRFDQAVDLRAGRPAGYLRAFGNHTAADDYRDGKGNRVHSGYDRWNAGLIMGLTPDDDTRVELTLQHSDGEAAYADRSMDGSSFARDNIGLKIERKRLTAWLEKLEASAYYNYVDHVMDNYSLRPAGMSRSAMNPDRETRGGRVAGDIRLGERTLLQAGADHQQNIHTSRMAMSMMGGPLADYRDLPRVEDARFSQTGLFAELTHDQSDDRRLVAGWRGDLWRARDGRDTLMLGGMMGGGMTPNPSAGMTRRETLHSGFLRQELTLKGGATAYAGLGHSERFPDYWELIAHNKEGESGSVSAFAEIEPERTTQLDVGIQHDNGFHSWSVSAFYSDVQDYLLIESGVPRMMPMRTATLTRNVDARTWGGELGGGLKLSPAWRVDGSLAYVRGDNRTDGTPLAQLPPLEARVALGWQQGRWQAGALWRLVAAQNRVDIGKGNIVGQDIGPSGGFGVFSLNGGYQLRERWQLTWGVDNLFDKAYAEHISRSGANGIAGYTQTLRVNEPGRTLWARLQTTF